MLKWFMRRMLVSLGLLFLLLSPFSPITASPGPARVAAATSFTSAGGPVAGHSPALAQMLGPLDSGPTNPFDLELVQVGQPAPDFILLDYQNRAVQLSQFRGKKIVVLVFYRGHW